MYSRSSQFYDNIYSFKDYAKEARAITTLIKRYKSDAKTMLELACGSGLFMEQFAKVYSVAGLDVSPAMLAAAQQRLPNVQLNEGDMTKLDLGCQYDVVLCLFGSIAYVQTLERLNQAFTCMAQHAATGGVVIIEPYLTPAEYWPSHIVLNTFERPDLKVSWMYRHQKIGTIATHNIHYLVGTPEGIEQFEEQHTLGLFSEADIQDACSRAGLSFTTVEHMPGKFVHVALKA